MCVWLLAAVLADGSAQSASESRSAAVHGRGGRRLESCVRSRHQQDARRHQDTAAAAAAARVLSRRTQLRILLEHHIMTSRH